MLERELVVQNRAGIHARPATKIVEIASKYKAQIYIGKDKQNKINAKSIMGILTLGATFKSKLYLSADGADEKDAIEAIEQLFENRFVES